MKRQISGAAGKSGYVEIFVILERGEIVEVCAKGNKLGEGPGITITHVKDDRFGLIVLHNMALCAWHDSNVRKEHENTRTRDDGC